jgi:hypothetical protein
VTGVRRILPALLLLAACGAEPEREPAPALPGAAAHPSAPDTAFGILPPDASLALAPGAAAEWRIVELPHLPRYFEAIAWLDERTVLGLAGSNPVELRVDVPEYAAWNRSVWGAYPAPDGERMAWLDEAGIRLGRRGETPRLLFPRDAPPAPEGDLSGPLHWSPDGERLLAPWTREAPPLHGIVEVATGSVRLVEPRGEGYLLMDAFGWLDDQRVLFTAPPHMGGDGSPPLRTDLAVLDVATGVHRRITRVESGIELRPLARWGADAVLVAETAPGSARAARFSLRGTHQPWRRALDLPPGHEVAVRDTTTLVVVERTPEMDRYRLWLREEGRTLPLVHGRGAHPWAAWSPDGRRLLIGLAGEGGVRVLERR